MAMTAGASGNVKSEINITPLVDVVLVLLIIFMVATPILQMGIDVEVPPKQEVAAPPSPNDLTQLVIVIRREGMFLNRQPVATLKDLRDQIARQMQSRPKMEDRVVFINAEDDLAFEGAVAAMDAAREAGAVKVGFLTDPPKD